MQVSVHEVENEVNVAIVFSANHILQSNDVLMACQLLQKDDLAEGSLCVRGVLEGVEVLFKGHDFLCSLVDGLPDDAIRTLA